MVTQHISAPAPVVSPFARIGSSVSKCTTAADVMHTAKLDWTVSRRAIALAASGEIIPDNFALVRDDTDATLAIVGPTYRELQQADAFAPFDDLVSQGLLAYHDAGASDSGKRIWIRASLPTINLVAIGKAKVGDRVGASVVLSHGHGGAGVSVRGYIERLVCLNGARVIDMGEGTRMRHTGDIAGRMHKAVINLSVIRTELDRFAARANALTEAAVRDDDAVLDYLAGVFRVKPSDMASMRKAEAIAELFDGHAMGGDLDGARGTYWGLYNALTEYLTHQHGRTDETRTNALVWGSNGDIVNRGIDVAYAMGVQGIPVDDVLDMTNGTLAA